LVVTVAPETLGVSRRLHRAFTSGRWHPASAAEVAYTLIDRVVDGYEPVLAGLSVDVAEVEADVFSPENSNPSERIYYLKRQVLAFTRHTAPFAGPLDRLRLHGHAAVPGELDEYYRDVEDHLNQATHQLEQYSDLLNGVLDANLAQISVRQNEDMRRMSAWAAVFLLPTLLAGIWGMNFSAMPETDWRWGYPFALATMTLATGYLYLRLKRSGWI
jgi:magnesium transporter